MTKVIKDADAATIEEQLAAEKEAHNNTKNQLAELKIDAKAALLKEQNRNPIKRVSFKHKGKNFFFAFPKVNIFGLIVSAEQAVNNTDFIDFTLQQEGQNIILSDD